MVAGFGIGRWGTAPVPPGEVPMGHEGVGKCRRWGGEGERTREDTLEVSQGAGKGAAIRAVAGIGAVPHCVFPGGLGILPALPLVPVKKSIPWQGSSTRTLRSGHGVTSGCGDLWTPEGLCGSCRAGCEIPARLGLWGGSAGGTRHVWGRHPAPALSAASTGCGISPEETVVDYFLLF